MTGGRGHPFLARLAEGPVVADGAIGTMLYARGVAFDQCFDAVNLSSPTIVSGIHLAYLAAGAELLETNTFGANRLKLAAHGLADQAEAICAAGVRLAREAAGQAGRPVWIAGSIGPLGRALAPWGSVDTDEAVGIFAAQARALAQAGADLLILETFADLHEMVAAVRGAQQAADLPIVAQMTFDQDGRTFLGYAPEEIVARLEALGVGVIGANCSAGPHAIVDVMGRMAAVSRTPLAAMPNAGQPAYVGVALIGGCCGTTPEHIAAIREAVSGARPLPHARARVVSPPPPAPPPVPVAGPRGTLAEQLGRRFLLTVEVSPPRGAHDGDEMERCRRLRAAGVDAVDVADNPLARLRMSPWATAARIQEEVGLEAILHFTTRDRNLIRLQADLLAVHALGIRTVLVLRGDPPQMGDYPQASAVADITPSGAACLIKEFNQGRDLAGNPIGRSTQFLVGVALNPAARDPGRERRALERKLAAGADFVCTMPIFDPETLDRFLARTGPIPVPLLVGVLPLHSARHAEFLHNELPGMVVPEAVRAQMRDAPDGRETGLRLARDLLAEIRHRAAGAYLIPSFGRDDRIIELVREMHGAHPAR